MCIAILTTAGKRLADEDIKRCWSSNRDGAGMAYIKGDEVVVDKGFMDPAAFLDRYNQVVKNGLNEHPMLVHFRIATMGKISKANCHPFEIGRGRGNGAMIHNGSFFSGDYQFDYEKSDTRILAEAMRNNFNYDDVVKVKSKLEYEFSSYNKVAFLFKEGKYVILNEDQGVWFDGIWYSNSWFKPEAQYKPGIHAL